MNDAEKLDVLASWIDTKYKDDASPEVQDDLRDMAIRLRALGGNIPDALHPGVEADALISCPYCHAIDRGENKCQQCGAELRTA